MNVMRETVSERSEVYAKLIAMLYVALGYDAFWLLAAGHVWQHGTQQNE